MASAAAAFLDVNSFDGRVFSRDDCRRATRVIGRNIVMSLAAMVTVGLLVIGVTMAAAWIVNGVLAGRPQALAPSGPARLALIQAKPDQAHAAHEGIEGRVVRARALATELASAAPRAPQHPVKTAVNVPPSRPAKVARDQAIGVPLPRPYPGQREVARLPADQPAPPAAPQPAPPAVPQISPKVTPQIAAVAPPSPPSAPEKRTAPLQAPVQTHDKSLALPDPDSRTAVYDIAAGTVYLPNGQKLEAHSGLGEKMDDPHYVHVRMRGPTPPNVYELSLREQLFHGVRAIRLNPVDEDKMFGRDGMLAHSYMLGSNGQSNGCVSFKDYRKFLNAYLNGEVERLVVVPDLGDTSWRTAVARRTPVRREALRREPVRRYASATYSTPAEPSPLTW